MANDDRSILDDWWHQGSDDPEVDTLLRAEALAVLERYADRPDCWMSWEAFEAELNRAEAAGELPD